MRLFKPGSPRFGPPLAFPKCSTIAKTRAQQAAEELLIYGAHVDKNGQPFEPKIVYDYVTGLPISEETADKFAQPQQQDETSVLAPLPNPGESLNDPPTAPMLGVTCASGCYTSGISSPKFRHCIFATGANRMIPARGTVVWFIHLLTMVLCTLPAPGQEPPAVVDLSTRAVELYKEGKYAEAAPLEAEAVQIVETTFGPDDIRLAPVLINLGQTYGAQHKYADAESQYKRALQIEEKRLGPENAHVATLLHDLGALYREQSRYAEALPLYRRSLAIREKILGPNDPAVATALNYLGMLYKDQGRPAEAEPFYQRSLAIREKIFGPHDPVVAAVLGNLGTVYDDEGRYADAESFYRRAFQIDQKTLRSDDPGLATDINNLAELFKEQGKYADAESFYERALHIDEKAYGPDDPHVATVFNNLAEVYKYEGKYAEAEPLYKWSLAIREQKLGPDHGLVATVLDNLAVLYGRQGRFADAEPLLHRALSIAEKVYGPDNPTVAKDVNNLGMLYKEEGKFADAEPLFQRTLDIDEKVLGPNHPDVATALNNLASLYDREGKYAQAEPLYRRSLGILESAFGPDSPKIADSLNNLATFYATESKYAEAEPVYQRAFSILFQQFQYNFSYMTERERLEFLGTVGTWFPAYCSFVHRSWIQDPLLTGSMYNLLLWEKGLVASSVAGMQRQIEDSGDTQAIQLLGQLSAKRTQFAALLRIQPPDRDLWRKQIEKVRSEADDMEKALVARSTAFAARKKFERATWQEVRDALGPHEAAIEFVHFRYMDKIWTDTSYYAALVVTHATKDHPHYVLLGEDHQIEGETLTKFQHAVQTRGFAVEQDASLPGKDAYERIWKPLEVLLAGKTRIYLSPDGILNQIPLCLIPMPDGKLLMERYDLRLVSSTKDILRAAPPAAANVALLVGDPIFDLSEAQQRAAISKLPLAQRETKLEIAALSPNGLSRDAADQTQLPRLPGTAAEVNTVAKLMQSHAWKAEVYSGDLALKRVVEQANRPRVLHLATHGFFHPDQQTQSGQVDQPSGLDDPMLRSGLYFAGADRTLAGNPTREDLDNGVLTAAEAGSLNLTGTELVVLSACNTGQGEVENGEGVFGMRRAFEEAGAQAVLMSLWSVPDKETQELMQIFYSKWLAGTEKHEALRKAQLEMRAKVKREYGGRDLPYYWGAFVLVGR